jgi:uncharacterized protein (TIGR02271 family)
VPNRTDTTIIAAFRSTTDAQAAVTDLQAAGISRDDIYIETNASGAKSSSRSQSPSTEGGITGWFKSIFGDEDTAERSEYERAIGQGNTLLRVDVDEDEIPTVEDILNRHSPVEVHAAEGGTQRRDGQTTVVPVVKEDIQVGKRQVLRGGVRVYSRVVEEPVEESVRLREERARVERRPVNRAATEADLAGGQEQVMEVQEFAEEPVLGKQARVVEEVRLGKDVSERTETVRDTVRHTEVNVEQTPGKPGATFDDSDFRADFQKRYSASGASYNTYLPAYRYGYDMASDPQYKGRSFDEVESDLRSDYGRRYPGSAWEKMKDAISYGWDKVTGKAKATRR